MKTVPITVWIVPIILLAVAIFAGINDSHGAVLAEVGYLIRDRSPWLEWAFMT